MELRRPTVSMLLRIAAVIVFAFACVGIVTNVPLLPLGLGLWCLSSLVP